MRPSTETTPEFTRILIIAAQLGVLLFVFKEYTLHDRAFRYVSVLMFAGFLVHSVLPLKYRLPFFLFLSLTSVFVALDPVSAVWLIGIGFALIGITYLPLGFYTRVGMVLGAGMLLAASRADWVPVPWSLSVWPILAAMFMFRMIIYLYDTHHEKKRPSLTQTLCYFFMLPNVCFPLFPVVDYKRFQRNYYNEEAYRIYQRGISWILRGVIHLLAYRYVYQHLTLDPTTVSGLSGVLQFSFSAFLLYLQVSGSYHMIVGILLLFGFNLPETNHLYYLAASVNDFWRRINIYWKDFMMKIFYYPVYFRIRALGENKAIAISASVVFFATWFLHAYQWFWLRGTWLLEWHDALYWAILALLVIGNSLYETKYGRERTLATHVKGALDYAATGLSTLGIFLTMGLLWGMWSSDSLGQWLSMWASTDLAWLGFLVVIPTLFAVSIALQQLARRQRRTSPPRAGAAKQKVRSKTPAQSGTDFWKPAIVSSAGIVLVYALGNATMLSVAPAVAQNAMKDVRVARLNDRDQAQLIRGYYDNLITVSRGSTDLWSMLDRKPADWGKIAKKGTKQPTHDIRISEYTPNMNFVLKGAEVSINRWGLRDQDYTLEKPAGTVRVALLGQSYVFGSGVSNEEVFEAILEDRLNNRDATHSKVEILNFAMVDRGPVTQVAILDKKVLPFKPDVLFYVGQSMDWRQAIDDLRKAQKAEVEIAYPELARIVKEAGPLKKNESSQMFRSRMSPYGSQILSWAYNRIVATSRMNNIEPVFLYFPNTREVENKREEIMEMAKAVEAGFTVIDLGGVFMGQDSAELRIAPWDGHPNAFAHKLIADRLYDIITTDKSELISFANREGVGGASLSDNIN